MPMTRKDVLARAEACVINDREKTYGTPLDAFGITAGFWTQWLQARGYLAEGSNLEPEDVPAMLDLLKTARLSQNITHEDSWVDKAGYAACGGEVATRGE